MVYQHKGKQWHMAYQHRGTHMGFQHRHIAYKHSCGTQIDYHYNSETHNLYLPQAIILKFVVTRHGYQTPNTSTK